jgi:hypothetical protein
MRRIMISPPSEVLEKIRELAASERRTAKAQIEHILIEHVREQQRTAPAEVGHA